MKALQNLQPGRERILRFADMLDGLDAQEENFAWDFSVWLNDEGHNCKTAGCACGYLFHLKMIERDVSSGGTLMMRSAAFLGISIFVADEIFCPTLRSEEFWREVKPRHVAHQLRHYAETRTVKPYETIVAEVA